jgi:protein-disulfide isomerase
MITVNPHSPEINGKTNAKRLNPLWVVLLILAFGGGLATGYFTWGSQPAALAAAPAKAAAGSAVTLDTQTPVKRVNVPTEGSPSYGPANAVITIVEFSDFQCPYCHKWFAETWPQLQQAYAGKIRLVYRDFPLTSLHPEAEPAAEAANCAGEQNQYWPFHDRLMGADQFGADVYLAYASSLKLDLVKFKECLTSNRFQTAIQNDASFGASLGITGTPTFFVNGIPLVGAQPFSTFKMVIDQELASIK